jgi:DNA-binding beta-propeller fold protein YncE
MRYNIEHPVVNDARHAAWEAFQVAAWPTLILIDPEGYAVWRHSGEATAEQIETVLQKATPYYRKKGVLDTRPLRFDLEASKRAATPLRYPGKVLADGASNRLFIADSNHHRIVVTSLDGTLLSVIGSGQCGRADGPAAEAQFNQPQGMAVSGESLYVADTENHLIRRVDLAEKTVVTVAGTGKQARQYFRGTRSESPLKVTLNSPWALAIHENELYIAMAGFHQIWRMALDGSWIGPYAGSGREDIIDGPLLSRPSALAGSAFAQPSGLASDGTWLYVADSEGSSIRAVPLGAGRNREVRTVVGTSQLPEARLFTFGDVDGPASVVRLQHPLGVAFDGTTLYVADTYNNKIKKVDLKSGGVATLAGDGKHGADDSPARFNEPAGLSAAGGKLYVADTNNHRIRVVDTAGGTVSTLTIPGLKPPRPTRP